MNQPEIFQSLQKGEFLELVRLTEFTAMKDRYLATFKAADVLIQAADILTAPDVVQASWGDDAMAHKLAAQTAYKNAKDDLLNVLFPRED